MAEVFLNIVNMSISASWIVFAVLLLRLLLKKAPKWINVLLWGVVAVRLICPFSFESVLSLIPSPQTINPEIALNSPVIDSGVTIIDNVINPIISEATISIQPEKNINLFQFIMPYLAGVWLVGIAALLIYTIISFLRLKSKIGTAVLLRDNIYQSEAVVSPFVLGIIKPKIYLPFNMNGQDMDHVIAHEQAHLRRKDHLWKPLGFLILTFHWFNPLVWVGYILLCRDIELACDEKVVKEFNNEQRADYSQALLTCSANRRMIAACPVAFGELGVKDRVKAILNYKKPKFWIVVFAIVLSVGMAVCFLTSPAKEENVEPGYYKTEKWLYSESKAKHHTEKSYIITDDNELIVSEKNNNISLGTMKEVTIKAEELKNYAKKPELWLEEYNIQKIVASYIISEPQEPVMSTFYLVVKTKSGDVLFAAIDEDTENEKGTVKLTSLEKIYNDETKK